MDVDRHSHLAWQPGHRGHLAVQMEPLKSAEKERAASQADLLELYWTAHLVV